MRDDKLDRIFFIAPMIIFLLIFFGYPLLKLIETSFFVPNFSLEHYLRILRQPIYLIVLRNTLNISIITTLLSLLLAYPLAALISFGSSRIRNRLMLFVLIPFWVSSLVRAFSWLVLLRDTGLVNNFLMSLGLIDAPLQLVHNRIGVLIGMVHVLLPYMVFALVSVMDGIDQELMRAGAILGAKPFRNFASILLPLSSPGIAAGCLLVFILAIGFFITPALLGGAKETMIAVLIEKQVRQFLDFEFAAAISVVLLAITITVYMLSAKYLGINRIWRGMD